MAPKAKIGILVYVDPEFLERFDAHVVSVPKASRAGTIRRAMEELLSREGGREVARDAES